MNDLRLKEYRNKSKMSQRDVSERLKISQAAYWKWENGKSFPNSKQILKLSKIFNCTPNDLFGIKGVQAVIIDPLFEEYKEFVKKVKK